MTSLHDSLEETDGADRSTSGDVAVYDGIDSDPLGSLPSPLSISSASPTRSTPRCTPAAEVNPFGSHRRHVFAFTSAGKPLFSRYDSSAGESDLASFCGLFLVLMRSASPAKSGSNEAGDTTLRRITASVPRAVLSAGSHSSSFERVDFVFAQHGEMMYVMATRSVSPLQRELSKQRMPAALAASAAASDAACREQLRYCHLFLLSVAPTLNEVLTAHPSYDPRSMFSPADFRLLRELMSAIEGGPCWQADAVPTVPAVGGAGDHVLLAASRSSIALSLSAGGAGSPGSALGEEHVDALGVLRYLAYLLRRHCTTVRGAPVAGAAAENLLCACLVRGDRVLACEDRSGRLFSKSLPASDLLLLSHFARGVLRRQAGEAWAPVALPGFSTTGYVWCHCTELVSAADSSTASAPRLIARGAARSATDPHCDAQGLTLIQVSVAPQDFAVLSNNAHNVADALRSAPARHFYSAAGSAHGGMGQRASSATAAGSTPSPSGSSPSPSPPRRCAGADGSVLQLFAARPAECRRCADDPQQKQQQQQQQDGCTRHQYARRWQQLLAASAASLPGTPQGIQWAAQPAPHSSPSTATQSFISFFFGREGARRQRQLRLRQHAVAAVQCVEYFCATFAPQPLCGGATAPARSGAGERSGLACLHHIRRCVEGGLDDRTPTSRQALVALVAAVRAAAATSSDAAGRRSAFTVMDTAVPFDEAEGPMERRCLRAVLLSAPSSALLLAQLCQSYYRNYEMLTVNEKERLHVEDGSSGSLPRHDGAEPVLASRLPYQFSHLLKRVEESKLEELCVIVDGEASMSVTWYCVARLLHSLVL